MRYDIIVIGGGIIGLATGYQILKKKPGTQLLLIEKEDELAGHQTGNNSGVIHSGIYYKPGSLKARNCIEGYDMLVSFCQEEQIVYELCGKVIVATDEAELPYLQMLYERGQQNGLDGLKLLDQDEIKEKEPHVNGIKGIFVPQTGIIDYKQVSEKYAEKIRFNGGDIRLGEKVIKQSDKEGKNVVITDKGEHETRLIVNCAGLYSDKMAALTEKKVDVRIIPFRGEYYEIKKEKQYLVKNLVYPVPDPNFPFLGVHFTRMIHGGIEAGPNAVLAFAREGYKKLKVNPKELYETVTWPGFQRVAKKYWRTGLGEYYRSFSKSAFTRALQRLIPEIQEGDLITGGAGIRAQACERDGGLNDDFLILENDKAINVCNAPSPAATSSLAIGKTVSEMVLKRF
ncbi:MAG TPA: L-2-hydroxyglutarate oxidase [Cytophagales bacterium]|nr:L-2-hydroxyglutarate oxidase [Cytophagales bacterium]